MCIRDRRPVVGSEIATRFPDGSFRFSWKPGTIDQVRRDEVLFLDGQSRDLPWVTMRTTATTEVHLALTSDLIPTADLAEQVLVGLDDPSETAASPDLDNTDLDNIDLDNTAQTRF